METSLQLLIAFLLFLILVGMYFLQGFQNCISTFLNVFFPRAVYSGGASVGAVPACALGCLLLERSGAAGPRRVLVLRVSRSLTAAAGPAGEGVSVRSAEIWRCRRVLLSFVWETVQLLPRGAWPLLGLCWVPVKGPRIDKITRKKAYVFVCKNFVHLLMLEVISY